MNFSVALCVPITILSVPEVKKCLASGFYVVSTYHRNPFAVNYRSASVQTPVGEVDKCSSNFHEVQFCINY